ncbi:hypothetical protein IQ07DRAFT_667974 [Pyrenochaeta sp. DS3sAY3a]|nr:hypothetical protein IQ07DRAFT_667974 [Pyrenochaeta sp. DS3sAY3a]
MTHFQDVRWNNIKDKLGRMRDSHTFRTWPFPNFPARPAPRQNDNDARHFSHDGAQDLTTSPRSAASPTHNSRLRNRSMWAHALVLFNVLGIPLSHGPYLEYYYNTSFPAKSLTSLSLILALQILCLSSMPIPIGAAHQRLSHSHDSRWRLLFACAGAVTVAAQLALRWCRTYSLVVLQGPVLGGALGALGTLSMLRLAGHYRGNVPLVSVQSGAVGFGGAGVYTLVARAFLGSARHEGVWIVNAGMTGGTLLVAAVLHGRAQPAPVSVGVHFAFPTPMLPPYVHSRRTPRALLVLALLSTTLTTGPLLTHPLLTPLLLTQSPSLHPPSTASLLLTTSHFAAALSASLTASTPLLPRLGPLNTFLAATTCCGAVLLGPVLGPRVWLAGVYAVLHGLGFGCVAASAGAAAAVLLRAAGGRERSEDSARDECARRAELPARLALLMSAAGVAAFAGVVGGAAVLERWGSGGVLLKGAGGMVCVGVGVGLGVGVRIWWWRRGWRTSEKDISR